MIMIGIDPGLSGAIAALKASGEFVGVWDMPTEVTRKGKNRVDPRGLHDLVMYIQTLDNNLRFTIEQVGAMPGQGVTSMFNFGEGFGVVRAVMAVNAIPGEYITPVGWKKVIGCVGSDKEYSLTLARQYWPHAELHLKKHVGRADALLIAKAGLMKL